MVRKGPKSMKNGFHSILMKGLAGLLVGFCVFVLEMSVRLMYLYFWSLEQAPVGYWQFFIFYGLFGFLVGISSSCLLAIIRIAISKNQVHRIIGSLPILFVALVIVFFFLRIMNTLGVSLGYALRHLGIFLSGCVLFTVLVWSLGWLKNRFGTMRLLIGYGLGLALFISAHMVFLQFFSWERVFAKLPKSGRNNGAPNVLLLTVDTLRADRLGVYGYYKNLTPNMDQIAKEGVLFERAISQSPWTRPSFGSLLTSLYASQHKAFIVNDPAKGGFSSNWGEFLYDGELQDDVLTMAEIFLERGYTTIALQTNWQASDFHNFDQGFQYFLFEPMFTISLWDRTFLGKYAGQILPLFGLKRTLPFWSVEPTANVVYEAFHALAARGFPQPFFIWVNFMDPHSPYSVREERVSMEKVVASYTTFDPDIPISVLSDAYDSEIRYVDHYIGEMYDLLKNKGVLDNTIIIFLSDHGEEFGEHQVKIHCCGTMVRGRHHGQSLYDELLHVPLVLRYPSKIPQGFRVRESVQLIDVLPTVVDLTGLADGVSSVKFEGRSLLPLIANGRSSWEPHFAYSDRTYFGIEQKAVQDERYKLILHMGNGALELYDLKNDLQERNNLAKVQSKETERLRDAINGWMKRMGPQVPPSEESPEKTLRDEEIERLRSLGYVN